MENTIKCPHCGKVINPCDLNGDLADAYDESGEWHTSYESSCPHCGGYILYEDVYTYHYSALVP